MSTLANQLQKLAHNYVRRGAKANRRQQLGRMIRFLEFVEEIERPNNLHEIGRRHVVSFWKSHRTMAAKTRYGYWLALCELWRLTQKPGTPPRPFLFEKTTNLPPTLNFAQQDGPAIKAFGLPSLAEIGQALSTYRLSHSLSLEAFSILTDLSQSTLQAIEAGDHTCRYGDILKLFEFLNTSPGVIQHDYHPI